MMAAVWIYATAAVAAAVVGALLAFKRLPDKPHEQPEYLPIDEFFSELLEDADVQEMQAKRQRGEHRSFLERQEEER